MIGQVFDLRRRRAGSFRHSPGGAFAERLTGELKEDLFEIRLAISITFRQRLDLNCVFSAVRRGSAAHFHFAAVWPVRRPRR